MLNGKWIKWYMNLRIRIKIVLTIFVAALLSISSLTAFSYLTLSASARRTTREQMIARAHETLERSSEIVSGSVNTLEALALSPSLVEAVEMANQAYVGRDQAELDAEIAVLDEAWSSEDPSVDALVEEIANNEISDHLRSFMQAFPEEVEVFATDIQGLNVAMTERTGDYLQADEGWWIGAYDGGRGATSISEVDYDDTADSWAIDVGVPIRDSKGTVIGVLRGTVDISVVFTALSGVTIGETGYATLLDHQGRILYSEDQDLLMQQAPEEILTFVMEGDEGWSRDYTDLGGHPAAMAYRHLEGDLADSLGWIILLDQDISEADAPLTGALINSLVVAAVVALVLVGQALLAAYTIAQPLVMVTEQANRLALGDVAEADTEAMADIAQRGDEAGDLARAFRELRLYVREMASSATQLANGDLTVDAQPRSERDMLGNAFAQMVAQLRALIGQVIASANGVGAASGDLSAISDQSAQATNQVATSVQQVAAGTAQQTASVTSATETVEQVARAIDGVARGAQEQAAAVGKAAEITSTISTAVQQVAANASSGAQSASDASRAAREGVATVAKTIKGIESIKSSVALVSQRIEEMGQRSEQIGVIVDTIDDIASQTNLLALNAAIEAARAGEHGKGFAVVADEVRKLAEQSTEATQEIGGLIKEVQQTIAEAVRAMSTGAGEVEAGVTQAGEAGEALNAILTAADAVSQQVEGIAAAAQQMDAASGELVTSMDAVSAVVEENTAATEEMSASAGEVTQAMENIASVAEENSAATEEVSATVEEVSAQVEEVTASAQSLSSMAQELLTLVAQFKLPGGETILPVAPEIETPAAAYVPVVPAPAGGNGQDRNPVLSI